MKQGEVWIADLHPAKGQEMGKQRRVIIVSDNRVGILKLKTVVPLSAWETEREVYPWMVKIKPTSENGITKEVIADGFQVRSISIERLQRKVGNITDIQLDEIRQAVRYVLGNIPPVLFSGFRN